MKVGYSRTSTAEQIAGFEAQIRDLEAQGCERIFKEQVSSVAERPELAAAIDFIRDGDELIVTRLDRLARSVADLVEIIKRVHAKGAHLRIGNLGSTDPREPTAALIVNVLASIAQFERQIMLQRQREGIAKAKAEGRYRGRQPTARARPMTCIAWPLRASARSR